MKQTIAQRKTAASEKRAALVARVSTDRQAANEEGSLKNQAQNLRKYVEYRRATGAESWIEVEFLVLKGVSGKNSLRSPEFEQLFAKIRAGLVNIVICTSLERISRSVRDFLWFIEFLNDHGVEFICLKQNFDTTTPFGRAIMTILVALAQLEREQTSERTRDAMNSRAERGLWNGGRLLGYDPDPKNKSKLIPLEEEVPVVNYCFDQYRDCGSGAETVDCMNSRGYRTKSYTSRRGIFHAGKPFDLSTVLYMLRNPAYIGKKRISSPDGTRLVDAVWPPIVSIEVFQAAQRLLDENSTTNRNAAHRVQHAYVLSRGILRCGRCGSVMHGRSGTGRLKTKYFYYACPQCSVRVVADEVEYAVLERVKAIATTGSLLESITRETNNKLQKQSPALEKERQGLSKALAEIKSKADHLLENWTEIQGEAGATFVKEKLNQLAERRESLEKSISEIDDQLGQIRDKSINSGEVAAALAGIREVYAQLQPHERRDLVASVLKQATVSEREIVLEIYALNEVSPDQLKGGDGEKVRKPPNWLPD